MTVWATTIPGFDVDTDVLEEGALAMAQATIQNAINESNITRIELARRMNCHRSFITRMLSGSHNLTIKTMARSMAACGYEVRFKMTPIQWNWAHPPVSQEESAPAHAGAVISIYSGMGLAVPA
jgi:hypothetical protein